jgi:preprotein translocase subunit SecD
MDWRSNEPYMQIEFDREGTRILERTTAENIWHRLATVIDRQGHSAPVIQKRIQGGSVRAKGNFKVQEAADLLVTLQTRPVPHDLIIPRSV